MSKRISVIYVPGLGDTKLGGRRPAVSIWHLWGVDAEILQMRWSDDESWESKLGRLVTRIDELTKEGKMIGLVGASAGASAVINAYALRKSKILGCVLIAGKVNNPGNIGENYRSTNPAFMKSAEACEKSLKALNDFDKKRILSRYSAHDHIVHRDDSCISGAHNQKVMSFGHSFTIANQLLLGAPSFLSFLKNLRE